MAPATPQCSLALCSFLPITAPPIGIHHRGCGRAAHRCRQVFATRARALGALLPARHDLDLTLPSPPLQGGWGPPGAWRGEGTLPPVGARPPLQALPQAPPQPASSTLTTEQRERAERNRVEALRRQEERRAASQAGSQSAAPAPSYSAAPAAAAAQADSASSRPPSAVRGVFLRPQSASGNYASQPLQQQAPAASAWQQQQAPQRWAQPPCHSGRQLQPAASWQQPGSLPHAGRMGRPTQQQLQALPAFPSAMPQQSSCSVASGGMPGGSSAFHVGKPPPAAGSKAPQPAGSQQAASSSLYSLTSQRQQQRPAQQPRRGFAFTPPPGLAPGRAAGAAPAEPAGLHQGGQEAGGSFAVRKHPRAITPQAPMATTPAWQQQLQPQLAPLEQQLGAAQQQRQHQQQAQQWAPLGNPFAAPASSGPAAPAQQAQPGRKGGGAGGGKGRGRFGSSGGGKAGNITYSFDPTPQPQKGTTQVTLQQALSRHAKSKVEQQQQGQQQQQQAGVWLHAAGEVEPLAAEPPFPSQPELAAAPGGAPAASAASGGAGSGQGRAGSHANPLPPLPSLQPGLTMPAMQGPAAAPPQQLPPLQGQLRIAEPAPAPSFQQPTAAVPPSSMPSSSTLRRPPLPPGRRAFKEVPAASHRGAGAWQKGGTASRCQHALHIMPVAQNAQQQGCVGCLPHGERTLSAPTHLQALGGPPLPPLARQGVPPASTAKQAAGQTCGGPSCSACCALRRTPLQPQPAPAGAQRFAWTWRKAQPDSWQQMHDCSMRVPHGLLHLLSPRSSLAAGVGSG